MSFISCLFRKVTVSGQYSLMHLYYAAEGILERCCFAGMNRCYTAYKIGVSTSWALPKASLNSTVMFNFQGGAAPYWGGYNEFTEFFNNNSHFVATLYRSCFCHVRAPQGRDDINCFFCGCSCAGQDPVELSSDLSGCIISKFNLVNNSDSAGYFRLYFANIGTIIRESVISFTSPSVKWIYSVNSGSMLAIMSTFVIAEKEPQAEQYVSTANVQLVSKASTFGQFKRHPGHRECNSISKDFSHSFSVSLLPFSLLSLTILTAIPA